MIKYKLAPIEPDNESVWNAMQLQKHRNTCPSPRDSYKTMLANCETVEVVGVDSFLFNQMREIQTDPIIAKRQDLKRIGLTIAQILDAHLKENGYMIVRKV